jgi:hypothetical protein
MDYFHSLPAVYSSHFILLIPSFPHGLYITFASIIEVSSLSFLFVFLKLDYPLQSYKMFSIFRHFIVAFEFVNSSKCLFGLQTIFDELTNFENTQAMPF